MKNEMSGIFIPVVEMAHIQYFFLFWLKAPSGPGLPHSRGS